MEEMTVMQPNDGNKFYLCNVQIDGENPDNGKPKKIKEVHLVEGTNPTSVEKKLTEQMAGTMFEWRIISMSESKIQFVY